MAQSVLETVRASRTVAAILTGMALSVAGAIASGLLIWTAGILDQSNWLRVATAGPAIIASIAFLVLLGRSLDLVSLGEQTAISLGASRAVVFCAVLGSVILAGAAVTLFGPIGFVGLAIPNLLRSRRCQERRSPL